jgi:hypothetical protein
MSQSSKTYKLTAAQMAAVRAAIDGSLACEMIGSDLSGTIVYRVMDDSIRLGYTYEPICTAHQGQLTLVIVAKPPFLSSDEMIWERIDCFMGHVAGAAAGARP